ncbi:MAG TPA: recombinase family protein [Fimbriiglobus sp.]
MLLTAVWFYLGSFGDKSSTLSAHSQAPALPELSSPILVFCTRRPLPDEAGGSGETAASYSRYSSDNQDVSSISQQQRKCREAATSDGYNLLPEFEFSDEAVSGTRSDRVGLEAMMTAARKRQFQVVYFDSLSRLAREMVISLSKLKELVYVCKVRVICKSDGIDSNTHNWELIATFRSWMHEEFLVVLRAAVLRGQEDAVLLDYSVGDWCFGYSSEPIPGSEKSRKGRVPKPRYRVVVRAEHAKWVRLVFHWYVVDRRHPIWIARELNRLGAPKDHRAKTPEWRGQYITSLLRRKKYIGIWKWGEKTNVRNPLTGKVRQEKRSVAEVAKFLRERHELRLVDDDIFFKAQGLLDDARAKVEAHRGDKGRFNGSTKDAHHPRHLLQQLIKCGACGHTYQVSGAHGKYLGCVGYQKGTCGTRTRLLRSRGEQILLDWVRDRILKCPVWGDRFLDEARKAWSNRQKQNPDERKVAEKKLASLTEKIHGLLDAIEEKKAGPDVHERLAARRQEKESLARRVEALQRQDRTEPTPPTAEWVAERIEELDKVLAAGGPAAAIALRNLIGPVVVKEITPSNAKRKYLQGTFTPRIAGLLGTGGSREAHSEPVTIDFRAAKPWANIVDRVKELIDEGIEYKAIARQLGCPRSWIPKAMADWHRERGLEPPDGRCMKSRLTTPSEAMRIADRVKELWDQGLLMGEIAVEMGCCRDTVTVAIQYWFESRGLQVPDGRTRRKELNTKLGSGETRRGRRSGRAGFIPPPTVRSGETPASLVEWKESMFQSAPDGEVGGNQNPESKAAELEKFQSALDGEVGGNKELRRKELEAEKFQSVPDGEVGGNMTSIS